jgi:hypothetical protein
MGVVKVYATFAVVANILGGRGALGPQLSTNSTRIVSCYKIILHLSSTASTEDDIAQPNHFPTQNQPKAYT